MCIAIIWTNHHYLLRFVDPSTLGLTWISLGHLFLVSLLPFATARVACLQLASSPVAVYAGLFVGIDIDDNLFKRQVLTRAETMRVSERMRRPAGRRWLAVLTIFVIAVLLALVAPRLGFALICCALILHVRPEVSGGHARQLMRETD